MPRRIDLEGIGFVQACLESAVRALLIGERDRLGGYPELAGRWYRRAEGSLRFAVAHAESLRSRRGLTHR